MNQAPELLLRDEDASPDRSYTCLPSLYRFHVSPAKVRGVMGPFGSGKSVAMVMEIMRRAREQAPGRDGKRRTRWAIVRNTTGELRDTSMKTFFDWVPPTGIVPPRRFVSTPDPIYRITEGDLDIEILFRALDKPQHIKKLLSLELTGAWINEARQVPLAIVEGLQSRCGRYPSFRDEGCTWSGLIMDTNPPDNDHWWYKLFEETQPVNWELIRQPSGRSPEAENLDHLIPGYYTDLAQGKSDEYIKVYIDGDYGFVRDGKPVWPEYNDRVHCSAPDLLLFDPNRPLLMGLDFGLTPAAVFAQIDVRGRWRFLQELIGDGIGIERFAIVARQFMAEKFPGVASQDVKLWGDPAGADPAQTDERTCFQILRAQGFNPEKAPTQNFTIRREAVSSVLNRLVDGEPGFLLSPACAVLRKALQGGYAYRRVQVAGDERFTDQPDKNRFSHPADALQYLMCGGGEAHELVRKKQSAPPKWDPVAAAKRQGYNRRDGRTWVGQ